MLIDMHVVQGLANLRNGNLKKAGKRFEEARQFKIVKKSELLLMVEKSLFKMIHSRIMDYFRNMTKS